MQLPNPWETTPKGRSFFVPTLDPVAERIKLLIESQKYKGRWVAECGVFGKKLGVLVTRKS